MNKIILWAPRVIALILILFISLFAFDGFVPGISGYEKTLAFVIGLLPAIILALGSYPGMVLQTCRRNYFCHSGNCHDTLFSYLQERSFISDTILPCARCGNTFYTFILLRKSSPQKIKLEQQ